MSAQRNDRQLKTITAYLGNPTGDRSIPVYYVNRKIRLVKATLINGAEVAASDTDFVNLKLKNAATVIAQLDSRTANQGAVTALVGKNVPLVAGEEVVASGATLSAVYDETDAGSNVALTDAMLQLEFYEIETA